MKQCCRKAQEKLSDRLDRLNRKYNKILSANDNLKDAAESVVLDIQTYDQDEENSDFRPRS